MNLRTRIDSARITWRSFEQTLHNQQKRMRAAKDAHDDHSIGRHRQALCASPHVAHPRELYNIEWQRLSALKRTRRRQALSAFFRPGS